MGRDSENYPSYEVPGEDFDPQREVEEAITAGRKALSCLDRAAKCLSSASGWGMLDIFGGGLISGLAKHQRIGEAQDALREAQSSLAAFSRELSDVREVSGLKVDIGRGWTFADFVFDGAISDIVVQGKIEDAHNRVDAARDAVREALDRLERLR
ncbi:MAG: hypothetical protein LKI67_04125 [Olsenella sp.]|jgi:hypothetical protein|nr:hypothetical protein [Olsenella sp.]MCI1645300.1 hypothetical protein [Olsenella sp.]MCI1792567.1 hypothetical protein [Olsenella sp.]MCI1811026.1 hypothetical protein [Olsenella sp.]MCI1879164.1 hypothetical protein [Olsenella sp.]